MKKRKGWKLFVTIMFLAFVWIMPLHISAATFANINASNVFLKQQSSSTCTLASATMLVRRASMMSGNGNWSSITESSMRSTAWSSAGLYNTFAYAGINVTSAKISSNRTQTLINLLASHPEGIVWYDFDKPHAILITDYTNGTFYCADPSSAAPSGRIPISQATISIESGDKYWYVASPNLTLSTEKPTVGAVHIEAQNGTVHYYSNVTTGAGATSANVTISTDTGISRSYVLPIVNGMVSGYLQWSDFISAIESNYTINISVTDVAGNSASNSSSIDTKSQIWVTPSSVTLKVGETCQFSAYINTIGEIYSSSWGKWQNQVNGISINDNGMVTALLPGEYRIEYQAGYSIFDENGNTVQVSWYSISPKVNVILDTPIIQMLTADTYGNINLTLKEVAGAGGYEIVRTKRNGKEEAVTEKVNAGKTSFQSTGLLDGDTWYYKIRAYRVVGEKTYYSDWSVETPITSMNLNTRILSASNEVDGQISIQWQEVKSAEGYLVYRSLTSNAGSEKLLTIVEGGNNKYVDTDIEDKCSYSYRIVPYLGKSFGETMNPLTIVAKKHVHSYETIVAKSTPQKAGSITKKCQCGAVLLVEKIAQVKTVTLSKTSYVYNGKVKKPSVSVWDSAGKKVATSNYAVKYSNNKKVGKATVTVTFRGNYSGSMTKNFKIVPKGSTISKLVSKKKSFTVKWKKQKTQTTGYQIEYSTSSKFKNAKKVTVGKSNTTSKTIKKLKAKKKYYVRIRTYKTIKGKKYYSAWSKKKSIVTK